MTTKEKFTAKDVQALRQRTGAGMMESKKALEENDGDMEKAIEYLRTKGIAKAEKRVGKQTSEGMIGSYIHHNGKVGVLVEVNCETDFVARTDDFKQLVKYVAEHIAAAAPVAVDKDQVPADKVEKERRIFIEQVKESGKPDHLIEKIVAGKVEAYYKDVALVHQAWVREPKKTIGALIKEASAKVGENIQVRRFVRFQMLRGTLEGTEWVRAVSGVAVSCSSLRRDVLPLRECDCLWHEWRLMTSRRCELKAENHAAHCSHPFSCNSKPLQPADRCPTLSTNAFSSSCPARLSPDRRAPVSISRFSADWPPKSATFPKWEPASAW